jgi:hypothetical protein
MDTHKIHKSEIRSETIIIFVIFLLLQNELKDAVTNHPELKEKSIQEGDVFFHVCGPEKNGYVRCLGLGPTPADLEMPGMKKYTSTRLQMEIEAHRHAD